MENRPLIPPGRLILVPQGAEFQAVQRGWRSNSVADTELIAIPAGIEPVAKFLGTISPPPAVSHVIVMGLCGGLSTDLQIGDVVIYQTCQLGQQSSEKLSTQQIWQCQPLELAGARFVAGVTSDRVICQATEKQQLHQSTGCQVVDMEGTAILQFFQPFEIPVTIVRVVSDDATGDLPDLAQAIDADGQLQPLPLALKMLQKPRAALRLIQGSLQGLKRLEEVAAML